MKLEGLYDIIVDPRSSQNKVEIFELPCGSSLPADAEKMEDIVLIKKTLIFVLLVLSPLAIFGQTPESTPVPCPSPSPTPERIHAVHKIRGDRTEGLCDMGWNPRVKQSDGSTLYGTDRLQVVTFGNARNRGIKLTIIAPEFRYFLEMLNNEIVREELPQGMDPKQIGEIARPCLKMMSQDILKRLSPMFGLGNSKSLKK